MRFRYSILLLLTAAVVACKDEPGTTAPTPPVPPPSPVLLEDIVVPSLPSPYYHFEYDATGRVSTLSFASSFFTYDVRYDSRGRIGEMRNITLSTATRLVYDYDDAGRVGAVRYVDSNGVTFTLLIFSYEGQKLTGIERDRRVEGGFIIDKTVSLSGYADGNLETLTEHRPAIEGQQDETTTVDRFEQYDDKINVDGFSLLHDDFGDQLILLPGVTLQKGNPAREVFTGDAPNYTVDYTWTYDDRRRPLTKMGDVQFTSGPQLGQRFQIQSTFSYH